jgi:hypothetical protein
LQFALLAQLIRLCQFGSNVGFGMSLFDHLLACLDLLPSFGFSSRYIVRNLRLQGSQSQPRHDSWRSPAVCGTEMPACRIRPIPPPPGECALRSPDAASLWPGAVRHVQG